MNEVAKNYSNPNPDQDKLKRTQNALDAQADQASTAEPYLLLTTDY